MDSTKVEILLRDLSSAISNLNSKFDSTSARYETVIQELRSENQRLSSEMKRIQEILKTIQGATANGNMEIDSPTGPKVNRHTGSAASKYSTMPATTTPITVPTNITRPSATDATLGRPTSTVNTPDNSWVQVLKRKPKAPLSDRKRVATARAFFAPRDTDSSSGYAYVYIPRSRNINRRDVRHRFSLLGIETARVIDISFPARSVIGVLLHQDYIPAFNQVLKDSKVTPIEHFNPCEAAHVADPKYSDLPTPQRSRLAAALQQDRCFNTLNFIREYLVPSVAKFFLEQGWINDALAKSVIQQRLPRPVKKTRNESYRGSAADAFLGSNAGGQDGDQNDTFAGDSDAEMGEEFHENAYGSDHGDDTTDDEIEEPHQQGSQ